LNLFVIEFDKLKKNYPYIIIIVVVVSVAILILGNRALPPRRLDERITLRKKDKIPYGSFVAFETLKYIFPGVFIMSDRHEPGYWDSLSVLESNQALIIISPQFMADDGEMKKLVEFAKNGNDVFISTRSMSYSAQELFNVRVSTFDFEEYFGDLEDDTLTLNLQKPPFLFSKNFEYPGRKYESFFARWDTSLTYELGHSKNYNINFIRLRSGTGNIYIHLAPLAFSNYFLLHKKNIDYYENVLSIISAGVKKIVWDEYYLYKPRQKDRNRENWLSVLFRYPALKWGLLTAIFTLLLFVLLEMRRKQNYIPVVTKPRNDSLDFVKTIGRLYFDKKDHRNLARKMSLYFLEHIRGRYKLMTNNMDESFIKSLFFKSGYDESKLREIISFIQLIDSEPVISDFQISNFYKQLESFYKTTI
jgi:hypothetical protein